MKKIIAAEEFAQLILCLYIFFQLPNHIGVIILIPAFFIPDLFAIGFLINNKLGTWLYNFSHHKLIAIVLIAIGFFTPSNVFLQAGIIAYAHSSFDRMIGYGLKYLRNPNHTNLGFIGKEKNKNAPDIF